MAQKKALERWEAKLCNCEVTPQAVWPIAKFLLRRDGPKVPTAIHGPSGLKFYPKDKANVTADCLQKQFTPRVLTKNHERRVEARIQALHEVVDENAPNQTKRSDVLKLTRLLKKKRHAELTASQTNASGTFQEDLSCI
jgi:hypothetical protein